MPEHTIPDSLIEQIRTGKAVLVVGAGIGVPSWKQLLERMNDELRQRGSEGDEAASKDVDKLLHKGSLVRAAGFLARALGEARCDELVQQTWEAPEEIPDVVKALATLPFRAAWTTFPGDLLPNAFASECPEGWSEPHVVTYKNAGEINRRHRYLLKVLGDYDSYVVTPRSVRAALSTAQQLRALIGDYYASGSLVFVGFRFGDPDLAALLDRVLGTFEPSATNHYLIASGVGPVTVDELRHEHDIEVVNLAGKGADEAATSALLEYLDALRVACEGAGITLAQETPDADDLDGWIAVLAEDPTDADGLAALEMIEAAATESGDAEQVVHVLMARVELEESAGRRAELLRQVAGIFETEIGDLPGAFTALTAALREDPKDTAAVDEAERLAAETDGWAELVGDVSQIVREIEDDEIAARYWTRLGSWYGDKLGHLDYALASYREAIKRDPTNIDGHIGLEELYRKQQRWAELADELTVHLELETGAEKKTGLLLALGDLYETQLASTSRAIEAYQAAVDLDDKNDDALAALERLYRRDERWGRLARVLEQRADRVEELGDDQRAAVFRRELATLRADKLGDLEGAIGKYESALEKDASDIGALRALEELYEKVGRTDDYLQTLGRLADLAPESEQPGRLRRLAAELEERGDTEEVIRRYERLLELEPGAEDAYRALERQFRMASKWYELVAIFDRHIAAIRAPVPRADLYVEMADVYEKELADPHRAIEAHMNALDIVDDNVQVMGALARLYQRIEAWDRAAEILVRHARAAGDAGAPMWHDAGRIAAEQLEDSQQAETWLEKALELEPTYVEAMLTLAELHKKRSNWANAVKRLEEAEVHSQNRLERVRLLGDAAELSEAHLNNPARALELRMRILEHDPEHEEAGQAVVDQLIDGGRWAEAEPILDMLARRAHPTDRFEKGRREARLARAAAELGKADKAIKHYRLAVEATPESLDAGLGLAAALYRDAEAKEQDDAAWEEVDKRYREILARHRAALADGQVVEAWFRIGMSARRRKDDKRADNAFRRALERDPHHRPSLEAIVEVAIERGDWKTVVEAKRDQLKDATEDQRVALFDAIGDIYAKHLDDPVTALGAYLEAIKMRPHSHVLLHKTLDIYTQQKQWRRAVETLHAIADTETKASRRSKYYYAAAVIARDELKDTDTAVQYFNLSLDDAPDTPKALEAIDKLLEDAGDYKNLARAYRKMLKRVGEEAEPELLLGLWTRLGDIALDHLNDHEAAIAAYEVASDIDPDNVERHEQLANLYLEAGEDRREDAIAELQVLIEAFPGRVELYRVLSNLYAQVGDVDRSFCLAQALVFLGAATDDERALFDRLRPQQFIVAKRRLTEELWQKAIIHPRENRHVNAIFSSLVASIAATTAQSASALDLAPTDRANLANDQRLAARLVRYATNVLGIDPEPNVYMQPDSGDAIRVANTADKGRLSPSMVIGKPLLEKDDQSEIAFDVGKRLAYLRPERYVSYALSTLPRIENAFAAALTASGRPATPGVNGSDEATKLAAHIRSTVPNAVLEHVGAVARKLDDSPVNGVVTGWRTATDLTANRVGLILCNDFETAAKQIATEDSTISTMPAKERLRDLLAYSVSESYFAVRRHLALTVAEGQ